MNPARLLLAALVAATFGSCAAAAAPPEPAGSAFASPTTLTYCTDGGAALTLDLFEPGSAGATHPLLIVIHGGSWMSGTDRITSQNALTQASVRLLLGRGFAVASINYRLAPRNPWPDQIIDTRCAVRYLRETAARWHLDPQRFAVLGSSAGGHLASLLGLSTGQVPQWDNGQHPGQSTAVRAVVDLWGPEDLTAPGWSAQAIEIGEIVFKTTWGKQSALLRAASPVTYIHAGAPAFLVVHGAADTLVPPAQSEELRARLASARDRVTLVLVAHAGHELIPSGGAIAPTIDELAARVVAFVTTTV